MGDAELGTIGAILNGVGAQKPARMGSIFARPFTFPAFERTR